MCGRFWSMRLSLYWRSSATHQLHQTYFQDKVPYLVNVVDRRNTVDQRMVQDQALLMDIMQRFLFSHPTCPGVLGGTVRLLVFISYGFYLSWFVAGSVMVILAVTTLGLAIVVRPLEDAGRRTSSSFSLPPSHAPDLSIYQYTCPHLHLLPVLN